MVGSRIVHGTGKASLSIAILGGAAAATLAALHPVAAQSMLAKAVQTVTCATKVACVSGSNTGSGAGVAGTSVNGPGLHGSSTSGIGLTANSSSNFGISGISTTGPAGVAGSTPNGIGVYGFTTGTANGTGVSGYSPHGVGVFGSTDGDGYGVAARMSSGVGLSGAAGSGTGLFATSQSGYGAVIMSVSGGALMAQSSSNNAIYGTTSGSASAVVGRAASASGGDFGGSGQGSIGVSGRAPTNGFPIVATDNDGNNLFYVDGTGDVYYSGTLHNFARTKRGAMEGAFSSVTAAPTMEDTGSAELVGGVASVALDPAFAAALDSSSAYRVFVTPRGDTRGLYVAATRPSGFVVRESQGGRSTVGFDYRVVATPLGQTGRRIALADGAAGPRDPLPAVPSVRLPSPMKPVVP
jgi:hypothetical protein